MLAFDDPLSIRPKRIIVAGVTGVGKTTMAARIGSIAGVPHTEIDALYHGPDWVPRTQFMSDVERLVQTDSWTTEWQYAAARPILAAHADLVVWLDLPFFTVTLPRVVARTLERGLRRTPLWNGNVEPPLTTFFTDRDHIVRWAFATRNKYKSLVPQLEKDNPQLRVVRLHSPREVEAWLAGPLAGATSSAE